jgi:ribosomal protein S18 acetylase RimI-like enzyme
MNLEILKEGVEVGPLVAAIAENSEIWEMYTQRQTMAAAQVESQAYLLRWSKGATDLESSHNQDECEDLGALHEMASLVAPLVDEVMKAVGEYGRLGRVMLTRLPMGGQIATHTDEGYYADNYCRFHICLKAGRWNKFVVGGTEYIIKPGQLFWFNHKKPHSVLNNSPGDRLHLIVDIEAPAFWARMGTYYQLENFFYLYEESSELLHKHRDEITAFPDVPLSPDESMYEVMQHKGRLRCFTVRCGQDLIGYAVFFLVRHAHYDMQVAQQDVLFVLKEHRRGRVGLNLIKYAETRLRAEGVDMITHHVKTTNGVQKVLERLGYKEVDRVLIKRLKG